MDSNVTTHRFHLGYGLETVLLVIPTLVPICVFIYLFHAHAFRCICIRFQALYLRIAFVFMILSVLLAFTFFFPETTFWANFFIAILEGYSLTCFYGLIIGWSWQTFEDLESEFLKGETTKAPFLFPYITRSNCCAFKKKESCMLFHTISVYQLCLTRPLLELIIPLYMTITAGIHRSSEISFHVPWDLELVIMMLKPLPLIWTMKTLIVVHYMLKHTEPPGLEGLHPGRKFVIVKLIFFFFVLNRILERIVEPNILFCRQGAEESTLGSFPCKVRFKHWIGLIQVAALSFTMLRFFGPRDLEEHPTVEIIAVPPKKRYRAILLMHKTVSLFDINNSYVYPPMHTRGLLSKNQQSSDNREEAQTNILCES